MKKDFQIEIGVLRRNKEREKPLYPPFFIVFVSIFELCLFVYYALRTDSPITLLGPVPFKSILIYNPYRRYEVWRFLTYTFVHAGYWHLSFNLLVQLGVGIPLETVHAFNPLFIVYFGGVIGGALGNSIADPHTYLIGASAGCYALIAAHLSNMILNWKEMKKPFIQLVTLLTFVSADLSIALYERHNGYRNLGYRTSYGGHIAGAVSGLLLGLIFLRNFRVRPWESKIRHTAATVYVTLFAIAVFFNIFFTNHFPPAEVRDLPENPFFKDRE